VVVQTQQLQLKKKKIISRWGESDYVGFDRPFSPIEGMQFFQ
jgi:hypothetical protein